MEYYFSDMRPHYPAPLTWDSSVQGPPPQPCSLLVTSGANTRDLFKLVHLQDPATHIAVVWWLLKHIWLANGQYASCLNAFLFVNLAASGTTPDRCYCLNQASLTIRTLEVGLGEFPVGEDQ